jgi:hypothetical protein
MFVCWSVKGGSGTTVVSAALAVMCSHIRPTLLVDLDGDAPAALGLPEPAGPGVLDWLASPTADTDALHRLAVPATDGLWILPRGSADGATAERRWTALATALHSFDEAVFVDAGLGEPPHALVRGDVHSVLVVRPCYLALRRVVGLAHRPTELVVVSEPGRALSARDVEHTVGAPLIAEVPYDPGISRHVDAGLLAGRVPRTLLHPLRNVA